MPLILFLSLAPSLGAADLDTIGVTVLGQIDPTLNGAGVVVAQPEAASVGDFEVDPATVSQPVSLFTYISGLGTATGYPNAVGTDSSHAETVAANFYGIPGGAATNVSQVDNYEAGYFFNNIINLSLPPAISGRVVNQSFAFATSDEPMVDPAYDNFTAKHGTIFASAVGNGGPIYPPGTAFNSIGVGVYGTSSGTGPTADGRCKPDITAPDLANTQGGSANSYSIPYVAGAAAVLVQAADRGDGGANTNATDDVRTIKALLLNGAVKPVDWTNGPATPLDARYGAGIVNVFNSWEQLKGGQRAFIESTTNTSGGAHPPGVSAGNEPALAGWDFNTISTPTNQDMVNHYYFNLPGNNSFTLTATLVWNRHWHQNAINNLDLYLYDAGHGNLVTCSTSAVDNVEHIFLPKLMPGRYDLQVLKNGSPGQVSTVETNALAFEFFSLTLDVVRTNGGVLISWPVSPTGFRLVSTASLAPPVSWTDVTNTVALANNQNSVLVPVGNNNQFFRLQRP